MFKKRKPFMKALRKAKKARDIRELNCLVETRAGRKPAPFFILFNFR